MLDVNANNEEAVDVDTDNQFGTTELPMRSHC